LAQAPWVSAVEAADGRPWALHLLALRLVAFDALGPEAPAFFLGDSGWRATWDALRPQLRADARLWWDARPAQLAFGLDRLVGEPWTPLATPRAEVVLIAHPFEWAAAFAPQTWDVVVGDQGALRRIGARSLENRAPRP
jgi:hypothetical protein